jgi:hypothetical protein
MLESRSDAYHVFLFWRHALCSASLQSALFRTAALTGRATGAPNGINENTSFGDHKKVLSARMRAALDRPVCTPNGYLLPFVFQTNQLRARLSTPICQPSTFGQEDLDVIVAESVLRARSPLTDRLLTDA